MKNEISTIMKVQETDVRVKIVDGKEYISLTDLAKHVNEEDPSEVIKNWMSQSDRLIKLNNTAKKQIELLKNNKSLDNLKYIENKINKE